MPEFMYDDPLVSETLTHIKNNRYDDFKTMAYNPVNWKDDRLMTGAFDSPNKAFAGFILAQGAVISPVSLIHAIQKKDLETLRYLRDRNLFDLSKTSDASLSADVMTVMQSADNDFIETLLQENLVQPTNDVMIASLKAKRPDIALSLLQQHGADPMIVFGHKTHFLPYLKYPELVDYVAKSTDLNQFEDMPYVMQRIVETGNVKALKSILTQRGSSNLWPLAFDAVLKYQCADKAIFDVIRETKSDSEKISKEQEEQLSALIKNAVSVKETPKAEEQLTLNDQFFSACESGNFVKAHQLWGDGLTFSHEDLEKITTLNRLSVQYIIDKINQKITNKENAPKYSAMLYDLKDVTEKAHSVSALEAFHIYGHEEEKSYKTDYETLKKMCLSGQDPMETGNFASLSDNLSESPDHFQQYAKAYTTLHCQNPDLIKNVSDKNWDKVLNDTLTQDELNFIAGSWDAHNPDDAISFSEKISLKQKHAKELIQMRKLVEIAEKNGLDLAQAGLLALATNHTDFALELTKRAPKEPLLTKYAMEHRDYKFLKQMPAEKIDWEIKNKQGRPLLNYLIDSRSKILPNMLRKAKTLPKLDLNHIYDDNGDTYVTSLTKGFMPRGADQRDELLSVVLKEEMDVNGQNSQTGETLLATLVRENAGEHAHAIKMLLDNPSTDLTVPNKKGQSVYSMAWERCQKNHYSHLEKDILQKQQEKQKNQENTTQKESSFLFKVKGLFSGNRY